MSAIVEFLRSVIGTYTPVTGNDGTVLHGIAGVNFEYIISGLLVVLCVYCVFKIIGGMICKNF